LLPSTDNARDLGSTGNSWKDLYIDGTAYLALVDINGGTIDGVSIGATTAATIINVDNLRLDGNTVSSTDTNGNVVIAPNGTGDVQLDADTVRVGDAAAAATLTSNGAGALTVTTGGAADLTLSTNGGTTSGTVVIANGANGNITLTPDGTGDVILSADRTQFGDLNTDTTLTTNGTGNLNLSTNNGTNSGTIQIGQGVNGNITLTPNGTGVVSIPSAVISGGTANGVAFLNASKVLTTGSALTFDGTNFGVGTASPTATGNYRVTEIKSANATNGGMLILTTSDGAGVARLYTTSTQVILDDSASTSDIFIKTNSSNPLLFGVNNTEQMRLTSTGLGIGTSSPTNKLTVDGNANVTGNTTLGDASTDTVTVNGYMGVGGASSNAYGINVTNSGLSGANQYALGANHTVTSAATSWGAGLVTNPRTQSAVFTVANVAGVRATNATRGVSSAITNLHGFYIEDQTQGTNNYGITSLVSSGTDKWNIYASGTAQNYFAANAGFGTTAPLARVHASRGASGVGVVNAAADAIIAEDDTNNGISILTPNNAIGSLFFGDPEDNFVGGMRYDHANDSYQFFANNAERMRIDSAGNVGIGTSSPGALLDVSGSTILGSPSFGTGSTVTVNNSVGGVGEALTIKNGAASIAGRGNTIRFQSSTTDIAKIRVVTVTDSTSGSLTFQTSSSGALADRVSIGATEAVFNDPGNDYDFRVESDTNTHALFVEGSTGNVGIGTSSPQTVTGASYSSAWRLFNVAGVNNAGIIAAASSGPARLHLSAGSSSSTSNNRNWFIASEDSSLKFQSANDALTATERMRLDASGNLLVGTTTNTNSSRLVVNGTISETVGGVQYQVVSQADIGTAPNEIPLNQYLGNLAYQDAANIAGPVGVGGALTVVGATTLTSTVGIGTASPSASAILDAQSTTQGVRMPNMTTTQKNDIVSPAAGLMVFDTTLAKLCVYSGAAWETITSL
jgi:sarcosine oxidase gamma subunit